MDEKYIPLSAAVQEFATCGSLFVHGEKGCKAIISRLLQILPADVRPVVRGEWNDNLVAFYLGCPKCGAFVSERTDMVFLKDFPSAVGELNFCPNCGADMRPVPPEREGEA